ncbi:MAG: hypothetical protein JJE51_10130 [Thermoanaerobaculia bacterium]|nr:hypothetical protein [Thermoanaerobaculia bacterium]
MILLGPDELRVVDAVRLELLVASREAVIGVGEGEVRGEAAAALLFSDYAMLRPGATLTVDRDSWAGAVWRIGSDARAILLSGSRTFDAGEALALGLCDEIGSFELGGRSAMALDAAVMLTSRRGGDALERAEFARLFAAGEPQKGLRAFLEKGTPRF